MNKKVCARCKGSGMEKNRKYKNQPVYCFLCKGDGIDFEKLKKMNVKLIKGKFE